MRRAIWISFLLLMLLAVIVLVGSASVALIVSEYKDKDAEPTEDIEVIVGNLDTGEEFIVEQIIIADYPPKLEVGQVWEDIEPNPFKNNPRYKILEKRDGYVRYLRDGAVTGSVSGANFVSWYARKLIEDPNEADVIFPPEPGIPPVWGQGELPVEHEKMFGNDNTARLDYVQNRVLDKHGAILKEVARRVLILEAVDPNAMRDMDRRVSELEINAHVRWTDGEAVE